VVGIAMTRQPALLKFLALQSNQASSNKTIKMVHRILRCVRRYSKQELVVVTVDVEMVDEER
jgi:hypothetical protein